MHHFCAYTANTFFACYIIIRSYAVFKNSRQNIDFPLSLFLSFCFPLSQSLSPSSSSFVKGCAGRDLLLAVDGPPVHTLRRTAVYINTLV